MYESENPDLRSFDPCIFWISFLSCATPSLVTFAYLGADDRGYTSVIPAFVSVTIYLLVFSLMIAAYLNGRRVWGNSLLAGLLAGVVIGYGGCLALASAFV